MSFVTTVNEFGVSDENLNKYNEEYKIKREEIIKTLNSLIFICEKAINEGAKILHNGI